LNDSGAIKTFNTIARSGIYFRVLREGMIDLNQEMRLISRPEEEFVSVADLFKMSISPLSEEEAFRLLKIKSLNSDWRRRIERALSK
jgi:MOSC domain-containing protein YiiM